MANSNEKEQKEMMPVEQQTVGSITEKVAPTNKNIWSIINSLIACASFIIALVALIFSITNTQNEEQIQKKLVEVSNNLTTELEQLKRQQDSTEQNITAKTEDFQHRQSELQNKLHLLDKQVSTTMQQKIYQNQDWLLLKARYFLELAQINAYWSNHDLITIALLQQADKLLIGLNESKIYSVRQAIAKEITQLKAVPPLDTAGLLSQLDAAQNSVSHLTVLSVVENSSNAIGNEMPKTVNSSAWHARLQESVSLFEKLVVVRRNDERIKPLMSPLYESILKESIRINLQEAQWAILNNNPVVYQLALKQASANIKRTFNEKTPDIAALIKQLNELQQIKLVQPKPSINLALPILNQVIEQHGSFVNQGLPPKKGETSL